MKIISFQNSKGGVGKTTLAINIAKCLSRENKVILYDADQQRTAYDWYSININNGLEAEGIPFKVVPVDNPKTLETAAEKSEYDYCIIDNPPAMSQFFITSIKLANSLVIPISSSAFDVWGLSSLVDMVNMINKKFDIFFVHNKIIRNAKMNGEIKEAIDGIQLNKHFKSFDVLFRQSYPKSAMLGKTVFDTDDTQAKAEIEFLTESIIKGGGKIENE